MIFNAPLSPVALELGPLSIYWYGVIIASGMLIGYFIADGRQVRATCDRDGNNSSICVGALQACAILTHVLSD